MGNGGRGGGRYSYASKENQMDAYDRLPASVRAELANGYENWAAYTIRYRWERGQYKTAKALVATIQRWNKERLEKDRLAVESWLNRREKHGVPRTAQGRFTKHLSK